MPGGVDPFLRQKWEYVFGTFFDLTKDGILEWCDFECLLEKIKATRGENSIDYQKELKAMKQIWDELQKVADENSDSMVTEQEWFQMWVNTFGDGGTRKADSTWQRLYQDYMFQLIDTSGDGLIDLSEYIEIMNCYGIDRGRAIWSFDKFAMDANGRPLNSITRQQFQELWDEFFYSKDRSSRGNYLFGDVTNEFNPDEVEDFMEEED